MGIRSPIDSITHTQWTEYVRVSIQGRIDEINNKNQLGLFLISYPGLSDLGLIKSLTKECGVWTGEWEKSFSLEAFLVSYELQYKCFKDRTISQMKTINLRHSSVIGQILEDEKASISGLLGIMWMIGPGGLDSWIRGDRKERSTKQFKIRNGIF